MQVGVPQYSSANVSTTDNIKDNNYDGIVAITCPTELAGDLAPLQEVINKYKAVDASTGSGVVLIPDGSVPGGRLVASPTGNVTRAIDDVRRVYDAGLAGMKRALQAGCKKPLLVVGPVPRFKNSLQVGLLGALQACYKMMGDNSRRNNTVETQNLGVYVPKGAEEGVKLAVAMESGRVAARDVCAADPGMMNPPEAAIYCQEVFRKASSVSVKVIPHGDIEKQYPCMAAVGRASIPYPKHHPCVVELDYKGEGDVAKNYFFVGKGVCYDTGGLDLKVNGAMKGMARDKGGAAFVLGVFRALDMIKPKGIRVHAKLGFVVNDIGPQAYRSDEIILSRAGVRVHVGNTDAEGRMVMVDLLCHTKETILAEKIQATSHIFTAATLTGHVLRAYGPYPAVIDNGPAAQQHFAQNLQSKADEWGDPFEISTLRRNDFEFIQPVLGDYDVLQANTQPSSATARGHQFPMAFMMVGAGLENHCIDAEVPIKYSHLDIAGAAGFFPSPATGSPVVGMTAMLLDN